MPGFTKLFSTILNSTIWGEPDHVRLVWITMLALSDQYGRVQASVPGIAHQARVTLEQARGAILVLEAPDPDSRTPEYDGRRIGKMDGGWRLLNYVKYREAKDEDAQRERKAKNKRAQRARESNVTGYVTVVTKCHPIAEAEAEAEAVKKRAPVTPEGFNGYDVSRAVRETLSLHTRELVTALDAVCCAEIAKGANPDELVAKMVKAHRDYFGKVEFEKDVVKFFGGGTWNNRSSWKFKSTEKLKLKAVN